MAEFMRKIHSTKQDTVCLCVWGPSGHKLPMRQAQDTTVREQRGAYVPRPDPDASKHINNLGIEFRSPRQLWFSTSQSHGTINTFLLSHLLLIVPSAHPVLPGLRVLRRYPSQITWTSMSPPAPNRPTAPQHHWAASQFVYFYYTLKVCTWLVMIVKKIP